MARLCGKERGREVRSSPDEQCGIGVFASFRGFERAEEAVPVYIDRSSAEHDAYRRAVGGFDQWLLATDSDQVADHHVDTDALLLDESELAGSSQVRVVAAEGRRRCRVVAGEGRRR